MSATKTSIRPLGNRVIVKRSESQTTQGGILLPDSAQEKPREGTVIAVGPGKTSDNGTTTAMTLSEGDTVLFSSYAGTEVTVEGEEFLIMSEDDVFGVIGS